jgi:hypothetical protein
MQSDIVTTAERSEGHDCFGCRRAGGPFETVMG